MTDAVIGVGSNLGDRMNNINRAVKALSLLPETKIADFSKVYETEPVGETDQPKFLNAVVKISTELSPMTILGGCLGIEAALGRERKLKDGPRIIDLDLLLFEGVKLDNRDLTLPHPRILQRAFVMVPLLDIYPTGRALGLPFGPHLKDISQDGIIRQETEIMFAKDGNT